MCQVDFIFCKIIRFKPKKGPVSVGIHVNTIGLSPIVTINISRTHVSIPRCFCELFLRIKEKKQRYQDVCLYWPQAIITDKTVQ